jgi:hypothetical protein
MLLLNLLMNDLLPSQKKTGNIRCHKVRVIEDQYMNSEGLLDVWQESVTHVGGGSGGDSVTMN